MRHLLLPASLCLLTASELAGCTYRSVGFQNNVDTSLPNNRGAVALGIGDLDGDGRIDAVVTNAQNEVHVLISKGDGSFATGVFYPTENVTNGAPRTVAVADLSGDDRADVVVSHGPLSSLSVYWNQGDGRLQAAGSNPIAVGCQPVAMALFDMSGDGQRDLVVACTANNEVHVLKNRGGQAGFDAPFTLAYNQAGQTGTLPKPTAIAVGQLDSDGLPDIVLATDSDLRILNSPSETAKNYLVSVPFTSHPIGLGLGDVNGDGMTDISVLFLNGGQNSHELRVLQSSGAGTFGQILAYQGVSPSSRRPLNGLGVADFVRDGRSDLVVALPNPTEAMLVLSHGETGTVAQPLSTSYSYPSQLNVCDGCFAVGDVTGDGSPDVVLGTSAGVSTVVTAAVY